MSKQIRHDERNDPRNSFSEIKDVAVYILDLSKGEFLYVGLPILEITGYLPSFFTKNGFSSLFEITAETDYARIKDKYATTLWSPRKNLRSHPEIFSDVFRVKTESGQVIWIENTIVILNYSDKQIPKKALGYLKKVQPDQAFDFKERVKSLQRIIMSSNPPNGLADISSIKNWGEENTKTPGPDTLLQVAFQGELDFKITKREREILKYIADGFSTKDIANILFISESTVVTHRKHLLNKFDVKNVAELVKEASKYFHFN